MAHAKSFECRAHQVSGYATDRSLVSDHPMSDRGASPAHNVAGAAKATVRLGQETYR